MKNKCTPILHAAVSTNRLRRELLQQAGFPVPRENVSVKLPLDFEGVFPMTKLYDWRGNLIGILDIVVHKHKPMTTICRLSGKPKKSSKHRVFAMHNLRSIPVGRLHQAKA